MPAAIMIPVADYLASSYRPDREYLDGAILKRNVGEWDHSRLQSLLLKQLWPYEDSVGLIAAPDQRVQVRASRFRVPDISVVLGNPAEQILTRPPLLVTEILSPEDSMSSMQERIDDYLQFGIENVWILDPRRKKAYWVDSDGAHEAVHNLRMIEPAVIIDLLVLWASS